MGFLDFVGDAVEAVGDVAGDVVGAVGDVVEGVTGAVGAVAEGVLDIGGNVIGGVFNFVGLDEVGNFINGTLDDVGGFANQAISFGGQFASFGLDPMGNLTGGSPGSGRAAGGMSGGGGSAGEMLSYKRAPTDEIQANLMQLVGNLQSNAIEPLRKSMENLDSIWIGQDADDLRESANRMMPLFDSLAGLMSALGNNIGMMTDTFTQTDERGASEVVNYGESWSKIY